MTNPADMLAALVEHANVGPPPNDVEAALWHEFAIARALASAADKRKRAADAAVKAMVPKTIGTNTLFDGAGLLVTSKTVTTKGTLSEPALRLALLNAGVDSSKHDAIISAARGDGGTQTTYTTIFR